VLGQTVSSQVEVQNLDDVGTQFRTADNRNIAPLLKQRRRTKPRGGQWDQQRHRGAIAGNGHRLTPMHAVQELTTVIAQLADRHLLHGMSVSPVIHRDGGLPGRPTEVGDRHDLISDIGGFLGIVGDVERRHALIPDDLGDLLPEPGAQVAVQRAERLIE
jgi:hypothetical protein